MEAKPTTYAARRVKYYGGPRDGLQPLEPVSILIEGHERLIQIGENYYRYVFSQGAFRFKGVFRGARDCDDCFDPIGRIDQ